MCFQFSRLLRRAKVLIIAGTTLFIAAWGLHALHRSKREQTATNPLRQNVRKPKPSEELYELPKSMWPAPRRDEEENAWPYDLFTPPVIELHDGTFHVREASMATLHLIELEEIPCRLKVEGFARKRNGVHAAFVRDIETGKLHMVNCGEASVDGKFSVENCDFPAGDIAARSVTVRDELAGRNYSLPVGRKADVDEYSVKIMANRYGIERHHAMGRIGEKIRHEDSDYELVAVDGDSIVLKRTDGQCIRLYLSSPEELTPDEVATATAAL